MIGKRFGRLIVVAYLGKRKCAPIYSCLCDCGSTHVALKSNLIRGDVRSCGCLHHDVLVARNVTHKMSHTVEYRVWTGIMSRCYNPNRKSFANYGGRGISVCSQWHKFENFIVDIGLRTGPDYSIDRIDNNGHYEPGNVRWATKKQQCRNRTSNKLVTAWGHTKTLAEWADFSNVSYDTIKRRLVYGWLPEAAISVEVMNCGPIRMDKYRQGTKLEFAPPAAILSNV